MAATVSNLGRGNYVLGGLGAVRGPSAADAMVENQQEARAAREAELLAQQRRQQMQLAQSEEARAQATFAQQQEAYRRQQAARAQAEAQRAAQQRAFAEYTQSLQAAPETPAAGVRRPTADFRTPTTEGVFPLVPTTPRAGITLPGVLPAAPAAAPAAAPVGPRIVGGEDRATLGGGAGADVLGAPRGRNRVEPPLQGPPVPPELQAGLERAARNPALTPEQRRAAAIQRQTLGAAAAVGGATVDMVTDAAALLQTLGTGLIEYGIGVPLSVASPELGARVFDQTADWYRTADELARMGEPLAPPAAAPATTGAPERTPPERTGQDPFITEQETEAGPIAGLTPAGQRDPIAATEAAVRAAPERDISQYFVSNPNLTLDLQTQMARERQMLEARLRYAEATQNISLYEQTFSELNSRERVVNENLIEGQIAILAAQQDNFGPLQEFMDRAYPNDNVEIIPYTNGTVSFFVNGQEDGEPIPVADLLDGMARIFNTEYREALAAAAAQQAERDQFLFENATLQQLQAAREISVAQANALAEMEAQYGQVDVVGDLASGDKLFQTFVPDRGYVQFRIVEAGQPLVNGQPAPAATVEEVPQVSPLR